MWYIYNIASENTMDSIPREAAKERFA